MCAMFSPDKKYIEYCENLFKTAIIYKQPFSKFLLTYSNIALHIVSGLSVTVKMLLIVVFFVFRLSSSKLWAVYGLKLTK